MSRTYDLSYSTDRHAGLKTLDSRYLHNQYGTARLLKARSPREVGQNADLRKSYACSPMAAAGNTVSRSNRSSGFAFG